MDNIKNYIDNKLKLIQDTLNNHINNSLTAHTESDYEKINIIDSNDLKLKFKEPIQESTKNVSNLAKDIKTDSNHRYITESQIDEFSSKVDQVQLDDAIKTLKTEINNRFDSLLSSKDSLKAINIIKDFLNDCDYDLINSVSSKVEQEEFDEFKKSIYITEKERLALNSLIKFIENGVDWNAEYSEAGYINNKPESLPANGGDAHTLDGYCVRRLMSNKSDVKFSIGIDNNGYSADRVSYLITENDNIKAILETLINIVGQDGGVLLLRSGIYKFEDNDALDIHTDSNEYIIKGEGRNTILSNMNLNLKDNITIKNIYFKNCKITVNSYCELINNTFENCEILIGDCNLSKIKDCTFDKLTKIRFEDKSTFTNTVIFNNVMYRNTIDIRTIPAGSAISNNFIL